MRSTLWMLVFGLALPLFAHAEPVRQVVPYSGRLDLDGAPYTGDAQMRFRFYTAPDVAVAEDCAAEDACAWEELHDGVQVFNGTFAVDLGTSDPALMAQVVAQNTQYWLELSVRRVPVEGEDPPVWVTLASRQAIRPTPQTLWAANASELELAGLRVTGPTVLASVTVDDAAAVGGDATVGGALDVDGAGTVDGDFAVGGSLGVAQTLTLGGLATLDGGVAVAGPASFTQSVLATAGAVLDDDLYVRVDDARGDINYSGVVHDHRGGLAVGDKGGPNVRIGRNEIVAVSGGLDATLYLNYRAAGGPVVVGPGGLTVGAATIRGMAVELSGAVIATENGLPNRTQEIGAEADRYCALARSRHVGLDGGDDASICEVFTSGGQWILRAAVAGGGSVAECRAVCLYWGN